MQPAIRLHSSVIDHLTTCESALPPRLLCPHVSRGKPQMGPRFHAGSGKAWWQRSFPPPPSPANHLKRLLSHAGTLGRSHQGLIRTVSGPSVMGQAGGSGRTNGFQTKEW